ncbi:hypothetical protein [Saccharopolyspora shandongensis]|uniref:hypothetical protein n=1 Tax=Saccharopolyspora shandongensis TaxID=418495 RepID=UPI0033C7F91B
MIDELRKSLVEAAEDDWVYFAEIETLVLDITGSNEDLLKRAGQAAAQLVREGTVVPGALTEAEGFTPWPGTPEESAKRIEREVAEMVENGTEPEMGDVCWFDLPPGVAEFKDVTE